jgi:ribose-phosphate pyrophosphokinase
MHVIALPGDGQLACELAHEWQCGWSELAVHRFPDGEDLVRIDASVQGQRVILAGSLDRPGDKTLPMLFAADAAREMGATQVGLVAPYLAYMRQDIRFHPGEAISSRTYARLLSASLDFLVTVDPHLHRWHSLDEVYTVPAVAVAAAPAIAQWIKTHVDRPFLVGPDAESAQWVEQVARLCAAPWAVLEKTRLGDSEVRVSLVAPETPAGATPVLLDDIVSTGGTLLAAAAVLRERGMAAPVCVAVHMLADAQALARLRAGGLATIASCDSVRHPTNAIALAPLLARALPAAS